MDSYVEYYQYLILFFGVLFYLSYFCATFKLDPGGSIKEDYSKYQSLDLSRSMYFILSIIVLELILVFSAMISRCSNVSTGIIYPILIWIFIFLGTKIVLLSNPGFKSAFSDVIGYYYVYGNKQNKFIEDLLNTSTTDKEQNTLVRDIISNKGLLFNSIVPGNFELIWESLKPVSKPAVYDNVANQQEFLNWVVQRDHIGEACWLLWSGILCISITSLYVYSFTCELTAAQVRENKGNYDKKVADDLSQPTLNFVAT